MVVELSKDSWLLYSERFVVACSERFVVVCSEDWSLGGATVTEVVKAPPVGPWG